MCIGLESHSPPITSHFSLPLCVILTISDRRILLSPKTLSLFHGCLMMFYHALGIMFTFPCMFKKRFYKTHLTSEYLSVKGAIDKLSSLPPPSPSVSLLLISPSFQDLTFSLKSPSLCYHSTRGSQKEL